MCHRFLMLVVGVLIPVTLGPGCSTLDVSAGSEGTGVQGSALIKVLARYQASGRQKEIAESKARQAFVDLAMKPAFEARVKELKKSAAPTRRSRPQMVKDSPAPVRPDPALAAQAELASLTASWREAANRVTRGQYAGDFAVPGLEPSEAVALEFPRLSESEVLAASASYVPRYLAVSVPAEQTVAGAKASVMLWDTRTDRLASDTVYALDRTPPTSKPSEIDNQKVQFAAR